MNEKSKGMYGGFTTQNCGYNLSFVKNDCRQKFLKGLSLLELQAIGVDRFDNAIFNLHLLDLHAWAIEELPTWVKEWEEKK